MSRLIAMLSFHGKFAAIAFLLLCLIATPIALLRQGADQSKTAEIGVEHAGRGSITITRTNGAPLQLIDIANEGNAPMYVSVPQEWRRGEVRRAPLTAVVSSEEALGFRRWSIPAHAEVSFQTAEPWDALLFHHAGKDPLRVKLVTVDLVRDKRTEDVYLVQEATLRIP